MRKKLQEYLPPILLSTYEFPLLCRAEQPELDALGDAAGETLDNQFVSTATERGIARYESIFGIAPRDTDTLEDRRFRVLTKVNAQLPYTLRRLRQQLSSLCGEDEFTIKMIYDEYTLIVRVALTAKKSFGDVQELLGQTVPANLVLDLSLLYNQHLTLSPYTHRQLSAYTYDRLRNEVMG